MQLPNAANAIITDAKLRYLLDPTHKDNIGKARVFASCGYTVENIDTLRADLLTLARTADATIRRETGYGVEWSIIGTLQTPNGRTLALKTGWQIDHGDDRPRFITGYPA